MVEIVNLNKARKQRERALRDREAVAARARHGRTRAERTRDAQEEVARARVLSGAKLDEDPTGA